VRCRRPQPVWFSRACRFPVQDWQPWRHFWVCRGDWEHECWWQACRSATIQHWLRPTRHEVIRYPWRRHAAVLLGNRSARHLIVNSIMWGWVFRVGVSVSWRGFVIHSVRPLCEQSIYNAMGGCGRNQRNRGTFSPAVRTSREAGQHVAVQACPMTRKTTGWRRVGTGTHERKYTEYSRAVLQRPAD
jgi:hypothetical protein